MPKAPSSKPLTAAASTLAILGKKHGIVTIAKRIGINESTVRSHSTGNRTPNESVQGLYASLYGIDLGDWTRTATVEKTKKARSAKVPSKELTAIEAARQNIAEIDATIAAAKGDDATSTSNLSSLFNAKTQASRLLAQLTGALDVSETIILKSPAWQRIAQAIADALRDKPDAAKAVFDTLTKLDEATN